MTEPARITVNENITYFIPVYVERDWAAAANAAADIFVATGMPIAGGTISMNLDTHVHLWEGPDDINDYACVQVTAAGASAYNDMDGNTADWSSRPAKGQIAYIIGITFVK